MKVNWWAGGAEPTPIVPRTQGAAKAMVTSVDMSGDECGLVAFVNGGPERSCGTWDAIRHAVEKGVPVVVFACGWSARWLPSLGDGRWKSAGSGVWQRGWRWVPDEVEPVGAIEEVVSSVMGWEKR